MTRKQRTDTGLTFPNIPAGWSADGKQFAMGLRGLMEQMQARIWQRALPVGVIILTSKNEKPFTFGEWESFSAGVTGAYGWKRVR